MPFISVLMPCYNATETLPDALDSLRAQTHADFQVVAVDDGSTDGTREILDNWAARDRRFQVVSQDHQGIIGALNAGISHCQAEYIARMDADDISFPTRLARQIAYLDQHPQIAILACQVQGYPPGEVRAGFELYMDWQNGLLSDQDIRREIFIECPLAHPSAVMRKADLLEVGGYQEHGWAEDYDLWLRCYLGGKRFAKLPEVLLSWREHADRLTRRDSRYSLENFLRAKAHYLLRGPLKGRHALIIWGAGMVGRRLSKHLLRGGAPLEAFIDVDPEKIGRTRRGLPILSPGALPDWWGQAANPVLLAAVGARGARESIRQFLTAAGLQEGQDWWGVA